jgi:hypothetical protein
MRFRRLCALPLCIFLLLLQPQARAYSLLTHEELIDLTWQDSIVPLLLARYPGLTPAQLQEARAYAYGGCVVQDIGYYPFGDELFSDLTHYVRSGDFVESLFRNAKNADELAFAVGALSHYIGDSIGHPEAVNIAVPVEFPKLRQRYGPVVSYGEGEHAHVRTEFAFDIDQLAHNRMAPLGFERKIGLRVPMAQLAAAFYQTYGISDFAGYHGSKWLNVREYRFAVRSFIPHIAFAVTVLHRHSEPVELNTPDALEIEREEAAVSKAEHWSRYRKHAGIETHLLAVLIFILPRVGPLSDVSVKGPTPQTEAEYMHSVMLSLNAMRASLHRFTPPRTKAGDRAGQRVRPAAPKAPLPVDDHRDRRQETHDPQHPLPNRDLDTGHVVRPGGYRLTDSTYATLLHRLTRHPHQPIPPGIVRDIEAYYSNLNAPITTKRNPKRWARVLADLQTLAAMPQSTAPLPYPTYGEEAEATQPQ